MSRHALETKIVQQIKAAKRGQFSLIRARYIRATEALGYTLDQARACFVDVWDIAELETRAEENVR